MCRPTIVEETSNRETLEEKSNLVEGKNDPKQSTTQLNRGFLYGSLSLALVVTSGSVVMGHFQSKRDELGCDTMCVGSMTSARSTLALLGSTIIGKSSDSKILDDKLGGSRKAFLLLGVLGSVIELLIALRATSISSLWVSMVPSAIFQQNFNVLKALFGEYHDQSASAAERAGKVGKLGMAAGLAFMVGPLIGSVLFKTYNQAATFALICLAGAIIFISALPRPMNNENFCLKDIPKYKANDEVEKGNQLSHQQSLLRKIIPDVPAARTPPAIFIMGCRICMALSFHIFQTIWTVALRERFNFGPQDYGRYYAFLGFGFALSQGFLAKLLLNRFGTTDKGRTHLLLSCALILGGGRFMAYQTKNIVVVYILFGFIITALGVVNTIFSVDSTKIASPSELGGLFGVMASMESIAGIIGPMLGGSLAKIDPVRGPLIAVLFLYGAVFTMVFFGYERTVLRKKAVVSDTSEVKKTI